MPIFVLDSDSSATALCKAILGFKTLVDDNLSTVTTSSEDPAYPLELAYDYKSNTEYSPSTTSGSVTITITQIIASEVSYFGLLSKNSNDCELEIEVEVFDVVLNDFVNVGTRSGFKNAKPQIKIQNEQDLRFSTPRSGYFLTLLCHFALCTFHFAFPSQRMRHL
jgi:hypothetical protein